MSQDTLSFTDRTQFGLIAAAFGAVIGAVVAVTALVLFAWASHPHPFNSWLIGFSLVFFFVVGFARGNAAADTVTDSLGAIMLLAFSALGAAGGGMVTADGNPAWRNSLWWTVLYFTGMILLTWLA